MSQSVSEEKRDVGSPAALVRFAPSGFIAQAWRTLLDRRRGGDYRFSDDLGSAPHPFTICPGEFEASGAEHYSLAEFADTFKEGKNVISLESHNTDKDSSDLSLEPTLVVETGE
jgi:hypothetical protein